MFVEQPVLPLAIVLHDFKLEQSHNRFIQIFQHQIPVLPNHCVLITDGEDALKNAFRCYYPKLQQLRCWNHVGKNIKEAAKLYYLPAQQFPDIDSSDPTVIRKKKREIKSNLLDTITNLFRSTSKSDFTNEYNIISQTWPSKFRDWFNKNLLPTIDEFG